MIRLADYFKPLYPWNLLYFVLLFFFFDILGAFVKSFILKKGNRSFSRILNWLLGFGSFVFLWFVLSLFIPYNFSNLLVSIGILLLIALPKYIKQKEYKSFFEELWNLKVPILIMLPFLPALFVKASLPPYYADEMAYHFISPSTLASLEKIKYTGGVYANSPRILNLFYGISFSLFKTYSIARLFNFTILATSMIYSYKVIRKISNSVAAFMFVFLFFSLPQDIMLTSTLGYVDVGAYSFLLIGLINMLYFLVVRKTDFLFLSLIFWAMNLGTKYTGTTAFVSFVAITSAYLLFYKRDFSEVFSKKNLFKGAALFLVFGGYWYIKNLVVYGNPIYPFIFPCWEKYAASCQTGGSFFGSWTLKVNLQNARIILESLFAKNTFLQMMVVATPFVALFNKNKKKRLLSLVLIGTVLIELLFLKYFSGFYVRYHQHMQLFLLLAVVLQFADSKILDSHVGKGILSVLFLSALFTYFFVIRNTNSLRFLNWYEINYSTGKMDIYDWIDWKFPEMSSVIEWCEDPPGGQGVVALARFDPDMIWYTYGGFMRSFMANCYYKNPPLEGVELEDVLETAKEKKLKFHIGTPKKCQKEEEIEPTRPDIEDDNKMYLRRLNNLIICNSEEVRPSLYYFDYEQID